MDRLTKWKDNKYVLPQGRTSDGQSYWRIVTDRLAAYENTGLEPDEIGKKIRVIVKHPGCRPRLCKIDNTLEEMQMIVGGHIEPLTMTPDMVIICNEEGRLHRLPFNAIVGPVDFVGTIIVAGTDGDEFADVPDSIVKMWDL